MKKIIKIRNHTANIQKQKTRKSLPIPLEYYSNEVDKFYPRKTQATALCPFHKERRPSLSINLRTGEFFCFGCGAYGGSILSFRMQRYQETLKQAIWSITGGSI